FESPVKDAAALKRAVQSSGETNDLAPVEILTSDGPVCLVAPWTLTDYYFDSPDLLLLRNGGSMRLRCNARGWDLLNVKSLSVKLDDAATVRYCSNIQLCPPKPLAAKDEVYAAAIQKLVSDPETVSVREAIEAVLHPPLAPNRPIVGRGSGGLVLQSACDHDPYLQFFDGPIQHVLAVSSTRFRFHFGGPATIELSFDISVCDGKTKIGLEFGLDHAGVGGGTQDSSSGGGTQTKPSKGGVSSNNSNGPQEPV